MNKHGFIWKIPGLLLAASVAHWPANSGPVQVTVVCMQHPQNNISSLVCVKPHRYLIISSLQPQHSAPTCRAEIPLDQH